jgi:16S rRNA U1498 N3-methylase RsmE
MPANPRFFCSETAGEFATLDAEEARHARRSLRLSPGDVVELFDGCGRVARGTIVEDAAAVRSPKARSRSEVRIAIHQRFEIPPPARRLTLIVAGCKGPRLSWLVEKCTELGTSRLVFAEFERSVVHVGAGQIEKLRRTAIEACKQCGSAWLPILERGAGPLDVWRELRSEPPETRGRPERCEKGFSHQPEKGLSHQPEKGLSRQPERCEKGFSHQPEKGLSHQPERCEKGFSHQPEKGFSRQPEKGLSRQLNQSEQRGASRRPELLIAHPDVAAMPAGKWFAHPTRSAEVAAVIGPEGGLTDDELQALQQAGGEPVRLGEHILRIETAAVALASAWAAA